LCSEKQSRIRTALIRVESHWYKIGLLSPY
jgi:hypothetical protein